MGQSRSLFRPFLFAITITTINWRKCRCFAWVPTRGRQNGRHRWIHWLGTGHWNQPSNPWKFRSNLSIHSKVIHDFSYAQMHIRMDTQTPYKTNHPSTLYGYGQNFFTLFFLPLIKLCYLTLFRSDKFWLANNNLSVFLPWSRLILYF